MQQCGICLSAPTVPQSPLNGGNIKLSSDLYLRAKATVKNFGGGQQDSTVVLATFTQTHVETSHDDSKTLLHCYHQDSFMIRFQKWNFIIKSHLKLYKHNLIQVIISLCIFPI